MSIMKCLKLKILTTISTILISAYFFISYADIVIHITHPWATTDSIRLSTDFYLQCAETKYYPGKKMTKEGGFWYTFVFSTTEKSSTEALKLVSIIPDQYNTFGNAKEYSGTTKLPLTMNNIFKDNTEASEVWITVSSPTADPVISFMPPKGKLIYFFNPWSLGAPRMEIKDLGIVKMRSLPDYCGWLYYNYLGSTDSVLVKFRNSLDSSTYSASGLSEDSYINLTEQLLQHDTIWIHGSPKPGNAPAFFNEFPAIRGDCGTISLASVLRDKPQDHPDFQVEACNGHRIGMVEKHLGSNGKPVKTDTSCASDQFNDWFLPETLTGGYTNEVCYNLTLKKNDEGLYQYDTNAFYPMDDFKYLDPEGKISNPNYSENYSNPPHNYYFTMELGAEFEYIPGQTFYFRGDDDVWVYIDSQLVVDIGGVHGPIEGSVDLDTLGLMKGQTYQFKLFFAERHCCGSNFKMITSINLRTSSNFFYEVKSVSNGVLRYDMFQKITQNNLTCDFGSEIIDTIPAKVDFYLEGPLFNSPKLLSTGISFGGITISDDNSFITLNENSITGLPPGDYIIRFYSKDNSTEEGRIPFTLYAVPKPHRIPNPVISAAYFADSGFGQVSRAELYYQNELVDIPDSVELFWPSFSTKRTGFSSILQLDPLNKHHITIKLTEPFEKNKTTFLASNKLGYSYTSDTSLAEPFEIVPVYFSDSVGPLITDAILIEDSDTTTDTLLLLFTETIIDSSVTGQSLELLTDVTSQNLTVSSFMRIADTLLVVIKTKANSSLAENDLLRINPFGPIRDLYNNSAHKQNRPVNIKLRKTPALVLHAFYRDKDADGTVDGAEIVFDRSVDRSGLEMIFSWTDGLLTQKIDSSRIRFTNDGQIALVDLKNAFNRDISCKTSEKMVVDVQFTEYPNIDRSALVLDSAAPVIFSASLSLSSQANVNFIDTLTVIFSEPVSSMEIIDTFPFFSGFFYKPYTCIVQGAHKINPISCRYYVILNGIEFPHENDSIWLQTGSAIDDLGNVQNSEINHRVQLKVNKLPFNISISSGPNPFHPSIGKGVYTIEIKFLGRSTGISDIDGTVTIYDALGNKVVWIEPSDKQLSASSLYFLWNGTNKYGRMVGTGTYLAIIQIKGYGTFNRLIGVKK